ncbi:magnesium/cobalt transporter CorA [Halomicronema sp. CCY15110]|uniref:magnesium/cobalt transporter CorA n=1 Tax=Halomicronema sp. CCY15110 TaxID=2767773 RepID=UPI001EF2B545|nr:magnesium/cobalt transporter CorA [Halomicronema sp. CCY15110]
MTEELDLLDYNYDLPGSLPGTLNIPDDAEPTELVLISYDAKHAIQKTLHTPQECLPYLEQNMVCWLDVRGLGTESVLRQVGGIFNLHPLLLEDVVNVPHRPKLELYNDQLLMIVHMVRPAKEGRGFIAEQVGFILQQGVLLTMQEESLWDCFDPVRDRLKRNLGMLRQRGVGYLAYTLLDTLVDGYFPVLEQYGEYIEALENEVVMRPTRQTLQKIHELRRELMMLRRYLWPQRTVINSLIRDGGDFLTQENRIYLQDVYDHIIQILDILETYREVASSLMDVYLSSVNNRMNDVMKLLTVISTIFIPLTFIAGVYGMNFNPAASPFNMPELSWYWGYPLCLGVMATIAIALFTFFWQQGWFANFSAPPSPAEDDR